MKRPKWHPVKILQKLGVTSPQHIDLEAIAYFLNATVKYKELQGCEARIIGKENRAIITVNKKSKITRQRFSIGHELGHWVYHKGTIGMLCQAEDLGSITPKQKQRERLANSYAAELIMPSYLFKPILKETKPSFLTAIEIAEQFTTSLTSTLIRMIELSPFPVNLQCYDLSGKRCWCTQSANFPADIKIKFELHYETQAFELLYSPTESGPTQEIPAISRNWIYGNYSMKYSLKEQSIRISKDKIITILRLDD